MLSRSVQFSSVQSLSRVRLPLALSATQLLSHVQIFMTLRTLTLDLSNSI